MKLYEPLHRLTPNVGVAKGRFLNSLSTHGMLHVMAPPKRPRAPGKWTYPATLAVICCKTWDIA